MRLIIFFIFIFIQLNVLNAGQFEELDKPPEGAHKGQIFLGASASMGGVFGKIINAENSFIQYSNYTFFDSYTTKTLKLTHIPFSFGMFAEFMPIDYMGIRGIVKRNSIVQRTNFGSQYQNWSRLLYHDISLYLGPSIHATVRKQWDIIFIPVIGYAFGKYIATPIASRLIYVYSSNRKKIVYNISAGFETNFSFYFSGGFFLSLGSNWTINLLHFDNKFFIMNPQTNNLFFFNKASSSIHSISFALSAGYAFSN